MWPHSTGGLPWQVSTGFSCILVQDAVLHFWQDPTRLANPCFFMRRLCFLSAPVLLCGILSCVGLRSALASVTLHPCGGDRELNPLTDPTPIQSPDFREAPAPVINYGQVRQPRGFGVATPAMRQPLGSLTGKIVFTNGGHGWTADSGASNGWRLQRGLTFGINEDYGNGDQFNLFADYCFNAGAIVVPVRPIGHQVNEVILDNTSAAVTFAGAWSDSSSPIYYGAVGALPYRFASLAATETATATYRPTFPAAGLYPVYAWTRHGSDRGDQLYRIRHTGGESQVRLPHHMIGNGWVYLGQYYFNAGADAATGSVIISNLRSTATGTVIIADALRFGNGMGSIDRGNGVSGYPREDESSRYWVQAGTGQGQLSDLYNTTGDDEQDSWSAPGRLSAEMNREGAGTANDRVHISFHSNAGGGRGVLGLITGNPTINQAQLAQLCGSEVNSDLVSLGSPPLEVAWNNRSTVTYTAGYSEISNSNFVDEMAATIIETGFHDEENDAKLLRDPKVRSAIGKAAMHAAVRYMNTYAGAPLAFLPESPQNLRTQGNSNGSVILNWSAPVSTGGSGAPTGYVLYRSTDGRGFGNPVVLGNVLTTALTGLATGVPWYFRIAATNPGGESFPSEVATCRLPNPGQSTRVLLVNAFDRFDRSTNPKQTLVAKAWAPPGVTGTAERVLPLRSNAFDYLVEHAQAVSGSGFAVDSSTNEPIGTGTVALALYPIAIWANGQESTADETFSASEQTRLTSFRNAGGHLMVSGSDIGWDLDRDAGPTAADRSFYNTQLKADLGGNTNDDANSYTVAPVAAGLFAGRANASFDDGSLGLYQVQTPDVLTPFGLGSSAALSYNGVASGAAAIQYDGSAGGGRVIYMGFPFETIASPTRRTQYMADILTYFTTDADAADPDLDRIPNLLEYATGSDPLVRDFTPPLTITGAEGSPTASFFRNPQAMGLTLTLQAASDLTGSWLDIARSAAGGSFVILQPGWTVQETGNASRPLISLSDPVSAPGRRFYRLRVERF